MPVMISCIIFMVLAYIVTAYILRTKYNTNKTEKINIVAAVIYAVTALSSGWLFNKYGYDFWYIFKALNIISVVYLLAFIDYREKIIPNNIVIYIFASGCVFLLVNVFINTGSAFVLFINSVIAMLFGGGMFAISKLVSKNGVGMGDVKLIAALGFYLGTYALIGVLLVSLISISLFGVFKVIIKKSSMRDEVPFAPFVAFGVTLCMILGF